MVKAAAPSPLVERKPQSGGFTQYGVNVKLIGIS
jgi:hypothetical protein